LQARLEKGQEEEEVLVTGKVEEEERKILTLAGQIKATTGEEAHHLLKEKDTRAETRMTVTVAVAGTETEEVEDSPATKPRGNVEAMIVVGIVTETVIVTVTEIVAAIGMVIVIEVDILAPGRESRSHQKSVPDWP